MVKRCVPTPDGKRSREVCPTISHVTWLRSSCTRWPARRGRTIKKSTRNLTNHQVGPSGPLPRANSEALVEFVDRLEQPDGCRTEAAISDDGGCDCASRRHLPSRSKRRTVWRADWRLTPILLKRSGSKRRSPSISQPLFPVPCEVYEELVQILRFGAFVVAQKLGCTVCWKTLGRAAQSPSS